MKTLQKSHTRIFRTTAKGTYDLTGLGRGDYGQPSCQKVPIDLWEEAQKTRQAHQLCAACPARVACLRLALAYEASSHELGRYGCWGGTYPEQRFKAYKQWRHNHKPFLKIINQLLQGEKND